MLSSSWTSTYDSSEIFKTWHNFSFKRPPRRLTRSTISAIKKNASNTQLLTFYRLENFASSCSLVFLLPNSSHFKGTKVVCFTILCCLDSYKRAPVSQKHKTSNDVEKIFDNRLSQHKNITETAASSIFLWNLKKKISDCSRAKRQNFSMWSRRS